jgi:TrmH family RNA methyltransferase
MEIITSRQNPRILALMHLRKPEERRKRRQFLVEGFRESVRAAENGMESREIFVTRDRYPSLPPPLAERPLTVVSDGVFAKISARENPDGILCLATIPELQFPATLPANAMVVVMEGMEKPGNLGALLRSMDAAGCNLCLLTDPLTDPWNPHVVRASQGALFSIPLVCCTNDQALRFLRRHRIPAIATSPSATQIYWNSFPSSALAIVAGNEHRGLSPFWQREADQTVSIPMAGSAADSLNVATATTLCLYEALRMRKNGE